MNLLRSLDYYHYYYCRPVGAKLCLFFFSFDIFYMGGLEFGDCALMRSQHQGSKVIFLLNCAVKGICAWRWKFAIWSEKRVAVTGASWQSHIIRCRLVSYSCLVEMCLFLKNKTEF